MIWVRHGTSDPGPPAANSRTKRCLVSLRIPGKAAGGTGSAGLRSLPYSRGHGPLRPERERGCRRGALNM